MTRRVPPAPLRMPVSIQHEKTVLSRMRCARRSPPAAASAGGGRPCRLGYDAQLAGRADVLRTDARGGARLVSGLVDGAGDWRLAGPGFRQFATTARHDRSRI